MGYLSGENTITEAGEIQPFAAAQLSGDDYSFDNVTMFELGSNYFIHGSQSNKIKAVYQFRTECAMLNGANVKDGSKSMFVLQYQASF